MVSLNLRGRIVFFLNASRRIFTVSKKPDWEEFKVMAKVTGLGIILIAVIGFIVKAVSTLVLPLFIGA